MGPLLLSQLTTRSPTLGSWIEHKWGPEHAATLEQATRKCYANVYECHVAPTLNDTPIGEITVGVLRDWQAALVEAGVATATIQKARTLLSSVLRHAAEAEAIPGNPLALVRAPRTPQRDRVSPLAPATVERIRRALLDAPTRQVPGSREGQRPRRAHRIPGRPHRARRRDALIVSLLAYAGLRPGELTALRWQDVGERTLRVERGTAPDGTIKATKNAKSRSVALLPSLAAELREWRLASGRPAGAALVIPGPEGNVWTKGDWQNWRSRLWRPACESAGVAPVPRPYDLRHSFASLLLAERRQHLYVAQQLGHAPSMLLSTYAHLLPELEDAERIEPEDEISKAREIACTS